MLERQDFEPAEFAALRWVRALLTTPGGPPDEVRQEFEAAWTPDERRLVRTAMKTMFCVNLASNTFTRMVGGIRGTAAGGDTAGASCSL